MIAYVPAERPSAAEALVGPFINAACTGEPPLAPAPQPWTLEALSNAGAPVAEHRRLTVDECPLEDDS